jgi:electron transfer flavoprotein beta subunit
VNIIVCIKQITDPEAPDRTFAIDPVTARQDRSGLSLVASSFDLNACEVALRLRDGAGAHVTAVSVGSVAATQVLRQALGMGFSAGVLLTDRSFHSSGPLETAYVLSQAIRKLGQPDLILTGCESGDLAGAAVGPLIAEELGVGCITYASQISATQTGYEIRRTFSDGYELFHASPPLVVTIVSDQANLPRAPRLRDIMAAPKQQIPAWTALDLGVGVERFALPPTQVTKCDVTISSRDSACEWIVGDTVEEKARNLAHRLHDLDVLWSEARPQ